MAKPERSLPVSACYIFMLVWFTGLPTLSLLPTLPVAATGRIAADASPPVGDSTPVPTSLNDLQFIDSMIANHAQAIAMASDGLANATDSQVRRIALRVAESQAGETQLLRAWRIAWYPDAPALENTLPLGPVNEPRGSAYDRSFLQLLSAYLRDALELANVAANHAEHDQLREYARTIVVARTSDIGLIESWLETRASQPSRVVTAQSGA